MLFDFRIDPEESHNVAFDDRDRPIVDALRTRLQDIVLGDGRLEVPLDKAGVEPEVCTSIFAPGADNGRINLPAIGVQPE